MDLDLVNEFRVTCRNPDGSVAWDETVKNSAVNAALNDLLTVYFANGSSVKTAWYLGLVDNSGFSGLLPADTMSSHGGWTEFQGYSEATRQAWTSLAVAGQAVSNGALANFTINTTGTLAGFFLASNSAKGGTSGQLWSTAALLPVQAVAAGQQVQITYTIQASATQ